MSCTYLPYKSTGYFSKLIIDYLEQAPTVQPFFQHPPTLDGIKAAIEERKQFPNHRQLLVEELRKQYQGIRLTSLQETNLTKLLEENTFTITTAHQPNIFTGHLYFIYKILHVIKLAQSFNEQLSENHFVPVFYMGSEDADLDELGHINLHGEKLEWKTEQTGSVGRMIVDKELIKLIDVLEGELGVLPHGNEVTELFRSAYKEGTSIQQATLQLVNELFKSYGLLILIPDNANLKRPFNDVVKRELLERFSHPLVEETTVELGKHYKVQASGREINLFYMVDGVRARITERDNKFWVSRFNWTKEEILNEVDEHPERFSANVILRGIFEEMILPNIAFVGGGGEIAYWLELKKVFEACNVPFPVLIIRNSFLLFDEKQEALAQKLGFTIEELFQPDQALIAKLVNERSTSRLDLTEELDELKRLYDIIEKLAGDIDVTLTAHVQSLQKGAAKKLAELEKKMYRAEKKKFEAEVRQLKKVKSVLFPSNSLQERVDNFAPYYAKYGSGWLEKVCDASLTLEQQFGILPLAPKGE